MSGVYADPIDASHTLAKAAAAVVYAADAAESSAAVDRLNEALQQYELCRLVSPVPVYRPGIGRVEPGLGVGTDFARGQPRYKAALATVDWRAQSPIGLADLLISIAIEVTDLGLVPNHDPAVQIVASKVAAVCGIAVDDDQVVDLIHECFRRSKQRDSRSPPIA